MQVVASPQSPALTEKTQALKSLADKLEAQFLAEMLKASGVGKPRDAFGGGAGEDHFSSFLTQEYAQAVVNTGGIGLSEAIFRSLSKMEDVE